MLKILGCTYSVSYALSIAYAIWRGDFDFSKIPRLAQGLTQPPIQTLTRAPSSGLKRPGRDADH
jgi:hypothetical protein